MLGYDNVAADVYSVVATEAK